MGISYEITYEEYDMEYSCKVKNIKCINIWEVYSIIFWTKDEDKILWNKVVDVKLWCAIISGKFMP